MNIYSLIVLLISNSLNRKKDKSILYSRILILILIYTILILSKNIYINKSIGFSLGLYYTSYITNTFHLLILLLSLVIVSINSFYPKKKCDINIPFIYNLLFNRISSNTKIVLNKTSKQFRIIEYSLLILFIVIGSLFIISSSDLISLFLSLELQNYGLYIISTIYRNSESSTSGGLTYFLLGGLSSCFILLSSAIIYVNSGLTYLEGLYIISNISDILFENSQLLYWYKPYYIHISLILLSVGLLFKISAAPFHFWSPYVYDSVPTIVTTFLAVISKISIFIVLLELIPFTSKYLFFFKYNWTYIILISALLSLIIGTIGGLTQFKIKKLYAYSTISHVGFILLSLSVNTFESIQAFFFYIIQYSISNLNAFIILLSIGYTSSMLLNNVNINNNDLNERNYSPIQFISQMKGYFFINSFLSLSLIITLFSFAGVPPLIGFFGKQIILSAALDKNYIFLVYVAIITSVISAVYYLALIKQIVFEKPDYAIWNHIYLNSSKSNIKVNQISLSSNLSLFISIITMFILLYIIIPKELLDMTNILSQTIFHF